MQFQSGAVSPVGSIQAGWNLIQNTYWTYVLMMLVMFVILIAASVILGFINNLITMAIAAAFGVTLGTLGDAGQVSAAFIPQIISMVISFFTNIIVVTISGILFCGIYSALSRTANTGAADFADLFSGFPKFQPCLIVAVVMSVIQFVLGLVTLLGGMALGVGALGLGGLITRDGQINPAAFGGFFLVALALVGITFIINLIVSALTAFVYPLIAERNLSGVEALTTSVKSGFANLGGIILLFILLGLMAIGGVFVCFIGLLFVAPVLSASVYAAFRSVFGSANGSNQYNPPPPPAFGQQPGY